MKGYFEFLERRRKDLAQISKGTNGEYSRQDLESEVWLLATDLGEKRNQPIDFTDEVDQQSVLARLFNRFVKFADKSLRWGPRLDQPVGDDEDGPTLMDRLAADDSYDPQTVEEGPEDDAIVLANTQASYSQVSFYAALMVRVDWSVREVANLVHLRARSLRDRLKRLAGVAAVQPSLFDGREPVPMAFEPRPGTWRSSPRKSELDPRQFSFWPFSNLDLAHCS